MGTPCFGKPFRRMAALLALLSLIGLALQLTAVHPGHGADPTVEKAARGVALHLDLGDGHNHTGTAHHGCGGHGACSAFAALPASAAVWTGGPARAWGTTTDESAGGLLVDPPLHPPQAPTHA